MESISYLLRESFPKNCPSLAIKKDSHLAILLLKSFIFYIYFFMIYCCNGLLGLLGIVIERMPTSKSGVYDIFLNLLRFVCPTSFIIS